MLMRFRCIKPLNVRLCDDDGQMMLNGYKTIEEGREYVCFTSDDYRILGGKDTLKLYDPKNGDDWMELTPETAQEHFIRETCGDCRWYVSIEGVCTNADSRHCADFRDKDNSCEYWEEK